MDHCPLGMPQALCPLKAQPYGQDPVFNPFSDIFDAALPGLEDHYYNTTTVSISRLTTPTGVMQPQQLADDHMDRLVQ